ncbi:zinc uptake protein ZrgA [Photobacterium sp. R1]
MNTQHFRAASWLLVSAAAFSGASQAHTQHEAHVHGQVELNIAQDGNDLLIEFTAPAADIVGFEHPPQTEQDQSILKQALQTLNQPTLLFNLNTTAGCHLHESHVSDTLSGHSETAHEHHHEHEHEHEHEKHDHHDHENHNEHAGFSAQYTFRCDTISKLKSLHLAWFTAFPATENIQVQAITERGQQAATLQATQPVFRF